MLGFLSNEHGGASAEYALIVGIISLGLGVAAWGLAGSIARSLDWAGAQIASVGGSTQDPVASAAPTARPTPSKIPSAIPAAKGKPGSPGKSGK